MLDDSFYGLRHNMFFIDDLPPLFIQPTATSTRRSISMFQEKAMNSHIRTPHADTQFCFCQCLIPIYQVRVDSSPLTSH